MGEEGEPGGVGQCNNGEKEVMRTKDVLDLKVMCAEWEGKLQQLFCCRGGDEAEGLGFKHRRT